MPYKNADDKRKYDREYAKANKRRVPLDVRKEYFDHVLSFIPNETGIGLNTFIKQAITEKIERDGIDLPIDLYKP